MMDLLEEVAGNELLQLGLAMGLRHLGDGHAGIPQSPDDVVCRTGPAPFRQKRVDAVLITLRPSAVASSASAAHSGSPRARAERRPLLVGGDGDGDPAVVTSVLVRAGDLVEVLGGGGRTPVAGPGQVGAVGGELNRLLGADVDGSIDHGCLHQATFAGSLAVLEREQEPEQSMQSGVRVPDAVGLEREQVRVPGQRGEPRGILDHEGEGRKVAPRPVEPEPWHPEHDELRLVGPERLGIQAGLVQDTGCVILDDHIARSR